MSSTHVMDPRSWFDTERVIRSNSCCEAPADERWQTTGVGASLIHDASGNKDATVTLGLMEAHPGSLVDPQTRMEHRPLIRHRRGVIFVDVDKHIAS